ncbi:hypothetical protein LWI28_004263 [Acer negundo]|uniref:Non-specific lipid-transfer protein n=1 Tax=Acer negundo TaxID=4023 RepID=A0AAD5NEA6_ACENE|nr:hypothetical protein LWI28_004263 [Acer negundo]KAK4833485.1 hypothetical protein QYF36_005811 [Acer negundo]
MASSMGFKLQAAACVVLVCMLMGAPIAHAITCGQVASNISPCLGYIRATSPLTPTCCNGVRSLNGAARTTPDRQQACQCLKSFASGISINYNLASGLPGKCGVSIPYTISPNTDCSRFNLLSFSQL